jgi:hypothetical protein
MPRVGTQKPDCIYDAIAEIEQLHSKIKAAVRAERESCCQDCGTARLSM